MARPPINAVLINELLRTDDSLIGGVALAGSQ
jgi:hypothetical protein